MKRRDILGRANELICGEREDEYGTPAESFGRLADMWGGWVEDLGAARGRKDDTGKARLDLLPPELLFGVGEVLAFGAKKYTQNWKSEWARLVLAPTVVSVKVVTLSGDAVLVTRKNSDGRIRRLRNASARTAEIGSDEIPIESRSYKSDGELIRALDAAMRWLSGDRCSRGMDSTKPDTPNWSTQDARFADEKARPGITSIIVTTQDASAASFAADATTVSGCLEIALKGLSAQSPIFEPHSGAVSEPGARNWEKGIAYSRVFAALMRHMWAWWRGEDKDAETGLSHLWHAGCCISFLIAFEQRGIGPDDRPSRPRD